MEDIAMTRRKNSVWLILALVLGVIAPLGHAQDDCTLAAQLHLAGRGHVAFTDGAALNVRDTPTRDGNVVGQLPEGTSFTVLSANPTCADGLNWYEISADTLQGWITEGTPEDGYFALPESIDLGGVAATDIKLVYLSAYSSDAAGLGGQLVVDDGNCGDLAPLELSYSNYDEAYLEFVPGIVGFYNDYSQLPREMGTNAYIMVGKPICSMGARYYPAIYNSYEFVPESVDGVYVVQPFMLNPSTSGLNIPVQAPQITVFDHPLPTVTPDESLFVPENWVWTPIYDDTVPDPSKMVLPAAYQGNLPALPIDLSQVLFVEDAALSNEGLTKLATNGFVVIPGGYAYFDQAYYGTPSWQTSNGNPSFVTTDTALNGLYFVYENTQRYLERDFLYGTINQTIAASLREAITTYEASVGTPLFEEARTAVLYYLVPTILLDEGFFSYVDTGTSVFPSEGPSTTEVLDSVPDDLMEEASAVVTLIHSAQGQVKISFMDNYEEDFSQYKPRSYYAGDPILESYFRAMMWLGRITFRAKSDHETQSGILALKALRDSGFLEELNKMDTTLRYLVGPADDLTYNDLLPLATQVYGDELSLSAIQDNENAGSLAAYKAGINALPGPRINSLILPVRVTADVVDELTRGFRVFGQRFTFDGYALQNLIFPEVGTQELFRSLPTAEDVPAVLGSDLAYAQIENDEQFAHFVDNMSRLRGEVNSITSAGWNETFYGAWLHAIQPLLVRNEALLPPFMKTDAWKARDLNTALGAYTELKHATLLYAEQAYGGRGGGGGQPPLTAYGYVEPNPLVFARVAILATILPDVMEANGYIGENAPYTNVSAVMQASDYLAQLSAELAEIARREVSGEPLTEEHYYMLQDYFPGMLGSIRNIVQDLQPLPPNCAALVADIASNPSTDQILYLGTGGIDTIYVITDGPYGLQLSRGAVYSSYSYIGDAQSRLTDDDWRVLFGTEGQPFRPAWSEQYFDTIMPDNRFTCEPATMSGG